MIKTIKLDENKFLLIEYFPRPKAEEEQIYTSPSDHQFECDNIIESVKLLKGDGITEFQPKEFSRMAKEFLEIKENKTVRSAEDLRI